MEESPHTKPIVTIAPVDLGATGSAGVERATFVTGGSDKAVVSGSMEPKEESGMLTCNYASIFGISYAIHRMKTLHFRMSRS